MMPKPKAYFSKKYKKISWHWCSIIELYWSKSMKKNGSQMKSFQSSKHFGDELYTFISISEIGLLASCYVHMT